MSKKNLSVQGIVAHGGVISEQVLGADVLDVRVVGIGSLQRPGQSRHVIRRRPDHQVHSLGGPDQPMEAHRRGADQGILDALNF